ncbi:MAG: HAD hydrolase family protein [Acidobacteriota bacterium]
MDVNERAKRIKLLLMDCDGVMTDGRLYFGSLGEELKVFNVRDGQGIASWHKAGFQSGIISGRDAEAIIGKRAEELGMRYVKVRSRDKTEDLAAILAESGLSPDEVCFIGDDIGDLGIMKRVGLAVAVADAVEEAKAAAHFVTLAAGGHGAIRELTDLLLENAGDQANNPRAAS